MSNRRSTVLELQREFNLTIPGVAPVTPKHYDQFQCDCEQCIAYRGMYQVDDDGDFLDTPELEQS